MPLPDDLSPFGEEDVRDLFLKMDGLEVELLDGLRDELLENDLLEDEELELLFFMFHSFLQTTKT